ncbi:SMP-30/gluconolactonase/LRE family protein [Mesorhizobium loti]|uniref:SMP-30/gluconolactonase/LRE family protein n=1 Tax=Rhizobium loti TaxID=381 RepID=UPI00040A1661|nr:SMP-30/gluconolactonase/LRE family protein [Mesorhizobium loti]
MNEVEKLAVEVVATGLGWPEGPTVLPDGRVVIVESYRSQLTAIHPDGTARRFAYVAGAPNACVLGSDGLLYVCQNGGTTGPWRAAEMTKPSIQRVAEGGKPEILLTEVSGIRLNGPNDLVFAADGRLIFSDPGTYNPGNPDPSYIFAVNPDGSAYLALGFDEPTFPNGVAVEADGSIVWGESYTGRVKRQRPDGSVEDLGRLPGDNPIPDGLKVGADGRLYVTDIAANGIHVLKPDGTAEGFFICGKATTNCVFSGEMLWVTNAGVLASGSDPSFEGTLCRMRVPGGGGPTHYGTIGGKKP